MNPIASEVNTPDLEKFACAMENKIYHSSDSSTKLAEEF
jgi:hypothetical protein